MEEQTPIVAEASTANRGPKSGYYRGCDKLTERHCSHCGQDWYCSLHCEGVGLSHRFRCTGRALTTVDYLEMAVIKDEFPNDPQTMEDYGFSRCEKQQEQSHLLGLYGGLFKGPSISSQELDQWK
jgi:hypothetical protein